MIVDACDLERRIEPWLQHMRWRSDFATWREKRLHSENYQGGTLDQLQDLVGNLERRRLLDLGCGMGGFAVAATRAGAFVTALDYNRDYCAITAIRAARYALPIPIAQAAGEALPLPDATFDVMCALDVLEHVQNPSAVLAEAARVLRKEGTLLITVINRFAFRDPHYHVIGINYLPRRLAELIIKLGGRSKYGAAFIDRQSLTSMHYYTFGRFKHLARQYGFRVRDLDEERVRRGEYASRKPYRRTLLALLGRWNLTLPLYRLNRALYQGTYRLVLEKTGASTADK